ncbi:hypothetical protein FRC09_006526 [Ceratobasidium sp. 395]|nr:hypothetical protein FRC09_006526 [Ceratobasidium sp. 395]
MSGVGQVQDVESFEPEYDNNNRRPVYWKNNILQPRFNLSFEENGKLWKDDLQDSVMDPSGMQEDDADILEIVSRKTFWNALMTCAFLSMVALWKWNCGGKGEERREKKKGISRRSGCKGKSARRMEANALTGLSMELFGFLTDPGSQSCSIPTPRLRDQRAKVSGAESK